MKVAESSLVRRLDEVRPQGRGVQVARDPVAPPTAPKPPMRSKPAVSAPSRKNAAGKVTAFLAKSRLQDFGKWLFFFLMVIVPTALGGVYFSLIASPQYVSEFRFSVRPNSGSASGSSSSGDALLAMSNSYIVSDYVESRDAVLALDKMVGLRQLYDNDSIDSFSRLDPEASVESLVAYWKARLHTSYDLTTGINVVEVSAFTPESAQKIASALKLLSENLVNDISDVARKSQMEFAHSELARAEARLKEVRREETELRTDQKTIDARKEADGRLQLNLKLRGELAGLQSQYDSLTTYMDAKSPRLVLLKNQIAATKEQISKLQPKADDANGGVDAVGNAVNTSAIARYDEIQTDLEIASKLYESSLTNYEAARAQANSNQIYLATYVQPSLPETSSYPRVFFNTFLIFLSACGVWVVLTLVYYSIRDHV